MSYDVVRFDEQKRWDREVDSMQTRDTYYYVEYCRLYQMLGNGDPHLFVYEEDGGKTKVIYPYLKREIKRGALTKHYFDIITPFGYGGPLANTMDPAFIERFRASFHEFCLQEKIVSEFIRFHPMLKNEGPYHPFLSVKYVRDMVYIDLRKSAEEIFQSISKSNRNRIRKARKENLRHEVLEPEEAMGYLNEFLKLYYETMDRNGADRDYYYPKQYFESMLTQLNGRTKMAAVFYGDKIVTADLILCEGDYVHCHVNAGDPYYFSWGSNALLNCETAQWGRRKGFSFLYLGGGYEKGDSLFRFKQRFNPTGITKYYIGKMVHNPMVYKRLVDLWKQKNSKILNPDYFPLYRQ